MKDKEREVRSEMKMNGKRGWTKDGNTFPGGLKEGFHVRGRRVRSHVADSIAGPSVLNLISTIKSG